MTIWCGNVSQHFIGLTMYGILFFEAAAVAFVGYFIIFPVFEYFKDAKKLRGYPSVSVAALTNAWMVAHQYTYSRTLAVDKAHRKYGKVVRIGPSHVSIATAQAVKDIYGHGTPATKDDFYTAYVGTHLNVSDTREKAVHSHKRKRFAVAFAQKSIVDLDHIVAEHLRKLVSYFDAKSSLSAGQHEFVNMKTWLAILALDINSVLLFSYDLLLFDKGNTTTTAETVGGKTYEADLKMAISESNHISTSLAWAPAMLSPNKFLTKWHSGKLLPFSFFPSKLTT